MRFDSRLPSAGPAINWRVESPFFNRCNRVQRLFLHFCLILLLTTAGTYVKLKPDNRSVYCRVVDPTASLLQAAGESLLTISQRQVRCW